MTIYVYHEYNDSQAYGTQEIKVFANPEMGRQHLKNRVENHYHECWDEIEKTIEYGDTFTPDYVSIDTGNGCEFFILEKHDIIS